MQEELLTDTEASIYLGITKELLYAYVRNAPKKALNHNVRLLTKEIKGQNMFSKKDLDSFNDYLKEPWSNNSDKRPEIPSYIQEYLKTEIGGKCPVTGKGYPLENAHIEDYSISKNHHHHNLIRIAKDEHTKYDSGILSKDTLVETKRLLIENLRKKMSDKSLKTKIVTYLPNVDIEAIKGRKEELNKIRKSIIDNRKVTIVNGFGGIGKTSLAQLYAKSYFHEYDYFFWIEFDDTLELSNSRQTFMTGIANNYLILDFLGIATDNKIPLQNLFDLVLNKIIRLPGRKLFVLDNVPSSINEFSLIIPEDNDFNVLGTSRTLVDGFVNINIDILKEDDAVGLFYYNYDLEIDDALVLSILQLLGFHTLTVELISKVAMQRQIKLTVLHDLILKEGINISIEAKVITKHDKTRKPRLPLDYLCEIFDISILNVTQTLLLSNLAIIGNLHLTFQQLESLLITDSQNSNNFYHDLTELVQLGWINKINDQYYIHQLICDVLKFKLKPSFSDCETLINNTCSFIEKGSNDFNIYKQRLYIYIAEKILASVDLSSETKIYFQLYIARHYGFSGNYGKYNSWYSNLKDTQYDENIAKFIAANHGNILLRQGKCIEAINTLEECKSLFEDERTRAQIEGTIAYAYSELGNFKKAKELFEPAYAIMENDVELDKSVFAVFVNNYANVLNGLGESTIALKLDLKALELRKELLEEDHPLIAQSYNNVGVAYEYLGELEKAHVYHNKALRIREGFAEKDNTDLAETYHNLGSIFFQKRDFFVAKDYFEKAIKIREINYPQGSPSLLVSYFCYASLLNEIDNDQAILTYRKGFKMAEKFNFDDNETSCYWIMGYSIALFKNRDTKEALTYINLAIKMFARFKTDGIKSALNIKSMILSSFGPELMKNRGRNEQCFCGSGKKYKKCCY